MTRRRTKKMETDSEILNNVEPQEAAVVEESNPLEPAEIKLQNPEVAEVEKKPIKEVIEAQILEKLSRKTSADGLDPFVPSAQLENEVKDVARKQGFPLSRGTEIGARLMARANRAK